MIKQADILLILILPLLGGIITSYFFELYDEHKGAKNETKALQNPR